ncbi:hypothetical protein [Cellvibrio sp. PSBB006]|uniref:hypothetical protein n=1 Tax=Cellvibrio sp. PSBB006 TaxID=1987723 RepID=UPI000B3B774A|nr:hypothetical protein [Cellvibrio sp. PSBB006]ARU27545.1 hypothetical protein CBR65_08895 [Cellvibrio sp. PSBB006]
MLITLTKEILEDQVYLSEEAPHTVVVYCLHAMWASYINEKKSVQELMDQLNIFFNINSHQPKIDIDIGYKYNIAAYWDDEEDDDGIPLNAIKKFLIRSRCVAYIDADEGGHGKDTSPYLFPAVAYSTEEIKAWMYWSLCRWHRRYPDYPLIPEMFLSAYFDIDLAADLIRKKLNCEIPWEFGPARINEPNFDLWHEKTRDQNANAWLAKWLD